MLWYASYTARVRSWDHAKQNEYFSALDQFFRNRLHSSIGVRKAFTSFDVTNVCNPDVLVPKIKGIKFFPDPVDAGKVKSICSLAPPPNRSMRSFSAANFSSANSLKSVHGLTEFLFLIN